MTPSAADARPARPGSRSAYAAFWCALLFALVNLYWTLGGTFALQTVGGRLARAVAERNTTMIVVLAITVVVKLGGAGFALALVQPWGRVFPRWLLLVCGWAAAAILIGYGSVLVGAAASVEIGIVAAPPEIDWTALRGHLYLWDMWFLVWGVLLGSAMVGFSRHR